MENFWMEMHCHCATGSGCAHVAPEEIAALYEEAGYNGVVITDHFSLSLKTPGDEAEYKSRVSRAVTGYHIVKERAQKDFTVLLGAEMSLATQSGDNHFLVYGLDEEFLYNSICMTEMTLEELYNYLHENGKMIFQSHPYREGCTVNDPRFLDGVEAFNDPRSKLGDNLLAEKFAAENSLRQISGSDFHEYSALASGGCCFHRAIRTNADLLTELKSGNYTVKSDYDY